MTNTFPALTALEAALPKLSTKDRSFATSLLDQAARRGLSEKQLFWVRTLTERATAPAPTQVQIGPIAPIVTLIEGAAKRLKWPAVLLATEGPDTLRISIAGPASIEPGAVNVTTSDRGEDGRRPWVGRVGRDGSFHPSPRLTPNAVANVTRALTRFACDPVGVAREYGHRTGHCCFCSKPLDNPISTALGYGPVCAKSWDLPHNVTAAKAA